MSPASDRRHLTGEKSRFVTERKAILLLNEDLYQECGMFDTGIFLALVEIFRDGKITPDEWIPLTLILGVVSYKFYRITK